MKRIAEFHKISIEQFKSDCKLDNAEEIYSSIKLPARATKGSAGYDFFVPFDIELKAGESALIPTGISAEINEGWVLSVYPRSGLGFKFRLQLDNTVGIIDSDYFYSDNEGHILIKLTNCSNEGKDLFIPAGSGFAQGIFTEYGITYSDNAENSRNGGFGSTG